MDFENLKGKTLKTIEQRGVDEILITDSSGVSYKMHHDQDCCECVEVEEVIGDFSDLLNSPILLAEVVTDNETVKDDEYPDESFLWTFYKLATLKGAVTIRWYGSSNGYYSEEVDFEVITNKELTN
jgi:hypothetical protein